MTDARGFPAFGPQRRSTWGRTWWARAWVQALEDTSLDAGQLRDGRRYANSGQVGTITISPGRIAAMVHAPEDTYEAVVEVDELTAAAWSRFLDQVAERAGHIAALLDGDMPHQLVEAAADAGVPLLPGIGDLDSSCTCDAWELPCQHAAALCYQVAWLLDADPFVLLLLRGRSREALLDDLQTRTSQAATTLPTAPRGDAWNAARGDASSAARGADVDAARRDGPNPARGDSSNPGRGDGSNAGRRDGSDPAREDAADGAREGGLNVARGEDAGAARTDSAREGAAGAGRTGSARRWAAGAARGDADAGRVLGDRSVGAAGSDAEPQVGVPLEVVLATPVRPLPDEPELPAKVTLDELAVSGIEPPPSFGPATLPLLVLDAARRARAILSALLHGTPEPRPLDEWADTIRLAADVPELSTPLTEAADRLEELALGIQAWRYGGPDGLDVLRHAWTPDPTDLARARTELVAADEHLAISTNANHLTLGDDTQLRLDRHGRWHPYRLINGTWTPTAPAAPDPLAALTIEQ